MANAHTDNHDHHDHHASAYDHLNRTYVDPQFAKASPGKIGMWLFLATDAMSFSGFLIAYGVLRSNHPNWPSPQEHLGLGLAGISTAILVLSSLFILFSIDSCRRRDREGMLNWLMATIVSGALFLGIQAYEYYHLVSEGITFTSMPEGLASLFGSTFYSITGFHGLHVLTGVIYNICMYRLAFRGDFDNGDANHLEIAGLFWHFVDLVWVMVFTFIYLL